jgi:cell division transport system permease protein
LRRIVASIRFAAVSAGQNFWRNLAISLAAVFVMFLILLMLGGTLLATHMGDQVLKSEQDRASNIKIFLQDGISQPSVVHFEQRLAADSRVRSVRFETKEEAATEAASRGLDGAQELKVNPFPASVNLDLYRIEDLADIDTMVRLDPIVDHGTSANATNYDPNTIPRLRNLILYFQIAGLVVGVVLACISLVIIMVTIRTAVAIRQREIEIMKLVGATDWFVRMPFIIEGILSGILAAMAASALIAVTYKPSVEASKRLIGFFPFTYDGPYLAAMVGILIVAGAVLGAFGSFLGVRRFLTV